MVDHYARMKFKMGSSVVYNGQVANVTGWSTNGEEEEDTTYSYQLNGGGELVNEKELTAATEPVAPTEPAPAPAPAPAAETS